MSKPRVRRSWEEINLERPGLGLLRVTCVLQHSVLSWAMQSEWAQAGLARRSSGESIIRSRDIWEHIEQCESELGHARRGEEEPLTRRGGAEGRMKGLKARWLTRRKRAGIVRAFISSRK